MKFVLADGRIVECEEVCERRKVAVFGKITVTADAGDWILRLGDSSPVWPKRFFERFARPLHLN